MGRTAIFSCAEKGRTPAARLLLNHIKNHQRSDLKNFLLLTDADGHTVRDIAQWDIERQEFTRLLDQYLVLAGTVPPDDQHILQQRLLQLQISRSQYPSRPLLPHCEGALLSKSHFRPGSVWAAELENFPILGVLPAPSASVSARNESSAASSSTPSPVPSSFTSGTRKRSAKSTPANQKKSEKKRKKAATVTVVAVQSLPHHSLAAYNTFMCLPPFTEAIMKDYSSASVLLRLARVNPDDQNGNKFLIV